MNYGFPFSRTKTGRGAQHQYLTGETHTSPSVFLEQFSLHHQIECHSDKVMPWDRIHDQLLFETAYFHYLLLVP